MVAEDCRSSKVEEICVLSEPEASAAMETVGVESSAWSSSTSWIVSDGSLRDSVSFETSLTSPAVEDGDSPPSTPLGVVLARPSSTDLLPCEITVNFSSKYEIHRVYVRSMARVYEIYYKSDCQDSNEYLCTVRCGETAESIRAAMVMEACSTGPSIEGVGTTESFGQNIKNDSGIDEDGWVDVNLPDSSLPVQPPVIFPKKHDQRDANMEVLYEATAEISDAWPCVSLTLRLLSLRTKESAHVEEIYIYADPVQPIGSDSPMTPTGNLGGNSVLNMLIPTILQLSKSRTHDSLVIDGLEVRNPQPGVNQVVKSRIPDCENVEAHATTNIGENTGGFIHQTRHMEDTSVPVVEQNKQSSNHVEKVLDELVSKVGRIETLFSGLEQRLLKPLVCIENRLEQLERQFHVFTTRLQPFAPDISFYESRSEGGDDKCMASRKLQEDGAIDVTLCSTPIPPCQASQVPEFSNDQGGDDKCMTSEVLISFDESRSKGGDDKCVTSRKLQEDAGIDVTICSTPNPPFQAVQVLEFSDDQDEPNTLGDSSNGDSKETLLQMHPCVFIRAPEFSNEDDEVSDTCHGVDDASKAPELSEVDGENKLKDVTRYTNIDGTLDDVTKAYPKVKASLTIDNALASALQAFLASVSSKFSDRCLSVMEDEDDHNVDTSPVPAVPNEDSSTVVCSPRQRSAHKFEDHELSGKHSDFVFPPEESNNLPASEKQVYGLSDSVEMEEFCDGPKGDVEHSTTPHPGLVISVPHFSDDSVSGDSWNVSGMFCSSTLTSSWSELVSERSYGDKNCSSSSIGATCEAASCASAETLGADVNSGANSSSFFITPPSIGFLGDFGFSEHSQQQDDYDESSQKSLVEEEDEPGGSLEGFPDSYLDEAKGVDDSDEEEGGAFGSLGRDQLRSRWADNSSTTSSSDEGACYKIPMGWSDGTSTSSCCQLDGSFRDSTFGDFTLGVDICFDQGAGLNSSLTSSMQQVSNAKPCPVRNLYDQDASGVWRDVLSEVEGGRSHLPDDSAVYGSPNLPVSPSVGLEQLDLSKFLPARDFLNAPGEASLSTGDEPTDFKDDEMEEFVVFFGKELPNSKGSSVARGQNSAEFLVPTEHGGASAIDPTHCSSSDAPSFTSLI